MPGPEDPDRPSGILPCRYLCIGFRCVKTVAVCLHAFTRLYQTSECAVTLPAYRVPCVRFICFVRCFCTSSTYATLGTGGWLDLPRQGLPPCKKRQASLGVLTLGVRRGEVTVLVHIPHNGRAVPRHETFRQSSCNRVPGVRTSYCSHSTVSPTRHPVPLMTW